MEFDMEGCVKRYKEEKEFTLKSATVDELWGELASRFHGCVLLCEGTGKELGGQGFQYAGSITSIAGLLHFAANFAPVFTNQQIMKMLRQQPLPFSDGQGRESLPGSEEGEFPNGQDDQG